MYVSTPVTEIIRCGFYDPGFFNRAARLMEKLSFNSPKRIAMFRDFIARLDEAKSKLVSANNNV